MFRALHAVGSLLLVASAASASNNVWVVDKNGGPGSDTTSISSAMAQASAGDIILVRTGNYSSLVIDGKGVTLVADSGAQVHVAAGAGHSLEIRNVPEGQSVLVFGLEIGDQSLTPSLLIHDNAGSVWIEQCHVEGGWPGIDVLQSSSVSFVDCTSQGDNSTPTAPFGFYSLAATALRVATSTVAIQGGAFTGGNGADAHAPGGNDNNGSLPGAAAVTAQSGTVFVGGSQLIGGKGGNGAAFTFQQFPSCFNPSPGGPGLLLNTGSPTVTLNSVFAIPGATGTPHPVCSFVPPPANPYVTTSGTLTDFAGSAPDLAVTSPVREQGALTLTLTGSAGAQVAVLLSLDSSVLPLGNLWGAMSLTPPASVFLLGALPPGGLSLNTHAPALGGALEGARIYLQSAAFNAAAGHFELGQPASLVLLDASF